MGKDYVQNLQSIMERLMTKNNHSSIEDLLESSISNNHQSSSTLNRTATDNHNDHLSESENHNSLNEQNDCQVALDDDRDENLLQDIVSAERCEDPNMQNVETNNDHNYDNELNEPNTNDLNINKTIDQNQDKQTGEMEKDIILDSSNDSLSTISDVEECQPNKRIKLSEQQPTTSKNLRSMNKWKQQQMNIGNDSDGRELSQNQKRQNKIKLNNIEDESDTDLSDNLENENEHEERSDIRWIMNILYPNTIKGYSSHEDHEILNYIIHTGRYKETKGRSLWVDMEEANVCNRTWQSMKEHFRKKIAPRLTLYGQIFNLSKRTMELFETYSSDQNSTKKD